MVRSQTWQRSNQWLGLSRPILRIASPNSPGHGERGWCVGKKFGYRVPPALNRPIQFSSRLWRVNRSRRNSQNMVLNGKGANYLPAPFAEGVFRAGAAGPVLVLMVSVDRIALGDVLSSLP